MTVLTLYVDANARPQGHRHLLARPPGIFCCAKALGLGTHFGAKAPGCPGGMVTGQIDTCIRPKTRVSEAAWAPDLLGNTLNCGTAKQLLNE